MTLLEVGLFIMNFGMFFWVLLWRKKQTATWRSVWPVVVPLIFTAVQIIVDGARWQMIPVYVVPLLICLYLVYKRKKLKKRRTWTVVTSVLLFTGYAALSFVLPAVLPVFHFPEPSGSYPVGTKSMEVRGTNKELMIQVWYPANKKSTDKPSPYIQDVPEVTNALSAMMHFPGFTFRHLGLIETHAYQNAALSGSEAPYPVLLFSHGLGGIRNQNTFQMEELASHGYIVIGIDHPGYAAASVFPDGRIVKDQHPDLLGKGATELDEHMVNWASDARFVLDQLKKLNNTEWIQGKMDLDRIGMLGHSYGGATAVYMMQNDARVKAAINMDGGIFGLENTPQTLEKPLILMAADSSIDDEAFYKQLDSLTEEEVLAQSGKSKAWHKANMEELMARRENLLNAGALSLILPGTTHISFSDLPLYSPFLLAPKGGPKAVHNIINEYTLAFFDTYLKGEKGSFPQIENHPNVKFQGPEQM